MNKKELMALPPEEAPETDIPDNTKAYVEPWCEGSKGYYKNVTNYIYTAHSLGDVLMLNFFRGGKMAMRTFIGADSFFNQLFPENKVSEAMADHTKICYYHTALYPLGDADDIISRHFKENHWYPEDSASYRSFSEGIWQVIKYQRTIKHRRLEERYRKIRESIDSCMLEIRPPVSGFEKWAFDHIVPHYIIYSAPSREGICTHCHNTVEVKAAHGHKMKCPCCRKEVTVLRSGAFHSGHDKRSSQRYVWYIQKLRSGIAMRLSCVDTRLHKNCTVCGSRGVQREFKINDDWTMEIDYYDEGRYFIDAAGNFKHAFEYGRFMNTDEVRWCRSNTMSGAEFDIYPGGADIIKSVYPEFQYIPIKDIIRGERHNPFELMRSFHRYPFIEYTWKLGLKKLTYDLIDYRPYRHYNDEVINTEGRNITEILRVGKADIKELRILDPDIDDLSLYQLLKSNHIKAGIDDIKRLQRSYSEGRDIIRCLKYQSLAKFVNYIDTQALLRGGDSHSGVWGYTLSDYCDYISDAEEAGYNLSDTAVLNPHDLTAAHDDADIEARIQGYVKKGRKYAPEIAHRAGALRWLYHQDDNYIIRPIWSFDELIEESRSMKHCVGSYADKYANGHCVILCVRRKDLPERAFATLELSEDHKRIIQLRGFKNSAVQEDVRKFCDEWLAMIPKLKKTAVPEKTA